MQRFLTFWENTPAQPLFGLFNFFNQTPPPTKIIETWNHHRVNLRLQRVVLDRRRTPRSERMQYNMKDFRVLMGIKRSRRLLKILRLFWRESRILCDSVREKRDRWKPELHLCHDVFFYVIEYGRLLTEFYSCPHSPPSSSSQSWYFKPQVLIAPLS